jgi:hypothetical protein
MRKGKEEFAHSVFNDVLGKEFTNTQRVSKVNILDPNIKPSHNVPYIIPRNAADQTIMRRFITDENLS